MWGEIMRKIKKIWTIWFAVLLMLFMSISFSACSNFYCDPKGKDWYNLISLPSISNPFNEIYDGCYSIKIDKDGSVLFKPLNGEEVKGNITTSFNDKHFWTDVTIQFEDGTWSSGKCYSNKSGRVLTINYGQEYRFTDKRQLSKEEFESNREQFIDFLTNVYQRGVFPAQQEIESNSLYQQFTNYYQIDPCCGGPIVYDIVERATIENIETIENGKEITLTVGEESIVCQIETENFIVANVSNDKITELSKNDISLGDCLVQKTSFWHGLYGTYEYRITRIFYFNNI